MSKEVLILGGGVAGLAAAVELARQGIPATLLEEKHFLGGRAYSFRDHTTGEEVDNGQHVLLTCYARTWQYLRTIGSLDKLYVQPSLAMQYREAGGKDVPVQLGWRDKWDMIQGLLSRKSLAQLDAITVEDWLERRRIPEAVRRTFYRPIPLAALNQDPAKVSAAPWVAVMRRAFGVLGISRIAIPTVGLTDLLVEPALRYLESRGVKIQTNQRVEKIHCSDNRVTGVQTQDGKMWSANHYLCALPPKGVARLLPGLTHADKINFSSIISIQMWLDGELTSSCFVGLLDTRAQWLFNRPALFRLSGKKSSAIALVISSADAYLHMSKEDIVRMVREDLTRVYPEFSRRKVLHAVVIKEKSATISHEPGQLRYRPDCKTPLQNLYLAGDWVNTGLPATIESAVQSAHTCVELLTPVLPGRVGNG